MDQQEQNKWAKEQLSIIMGGNNKTRYKTLVANPTDLEKVESALLNVAQHKAQAYKDAISGKSLTSVGWVKDNPTLAQDVHTLHQQFVELMDIAMLPEKYQS